MIYLTLKALKAQVDGYLIRIPALGFNPVKSTFSPLKGLDGTVMAGSESLVMSLVSIAEEKSVQVPPGQSRDAEGRILKLNPALWLNLYILFTANFSEYETSLKYLSQLICFFQTKNSFTVQDTPDLPPSVGKVVVQMHSLSLEEQHDFWGTMGANYLPSVLYKTRISFAADTALERIEPIREIGIGESVLT